MSTNESGFSTYKANTVASGQQKRPFIAKGHDAILKRLQDDKAQIEITAISGALYVGQVTNRDKYTITIEAQGGGRYTVYKHSIEAFRSF